MCQILYVCNSWPLKWRRKYSSRNCISGEACQGVTLSENAACRSLNSTIDTDFIDIIKMLSLKADNKIFPDITGEFEQADDQPQEHPSPFCAVYHPQ